LALIERRLQAVGRLLQRAVQPPVYPRIVARHSSWLQAALMAGAAELAEPALHHDARYRPGAAPVTASRDERFRAMHSGTSEP
jgi:hypothetical protein